MRSPALGVSATRVGRSSHGNAVGRHCGGSIAVVAQREGGSCDGRIASFVPADSGGGDDWHFGVHSPSVSDSGILGFVSAGISVVRGPALCVAASGIGRSGHGDTVVSQGEVALAVVGDGEGRGGDRAGVAAEVPADSRRGDDGLLSIHSPGIGDGVGCRFQSAVISVVGNPGLCIAASCVCLARGGHGGHCTRLTFVVDGKVGSGGRISLIPIATLVGAIDKCCCDGRLDGVEHGDGLRLRGHVAACVRYRPRADDSLGAAAARGFCIRVFHHKVSDWSAVVGQNCGLACHRGVGDCAASAVKV